MPTTPAQRQQATALRQLRQIVSSGAASAPDSADFAAPKRFRDSFDDINRKLLQQKYDQRRDILRYIEDMAAASFIFLVVIVVGQMVVRLFKPNYVGVSDTVINILTAGVFGQVIGIVAAITAQVWKAPRENDAKNQG
ncbi:MAG TPA: hypothetical protein VLF59_04230 [Candidatus Saccharimonadales bacterium]|nr:hypothetical protein [Candidatus Saccharimonadales bacterium]